MRPRKETHKKEPSMLVILKVIVKILVEFGAIASGIEYLIRIFKALTRF